MNHLHVFPDVLAIEDTPEATTSDAAVILGDPLSSMLPTNNHTDFVLLDWNSSSNSFNRREFPFSPPCQILLWVGGDWTNVYRSLWFLSELGNCWSLQKIIDVTKVIFFNAPFLSCSEFRCALTNSVELKQDDLIQSLNLWRLLQQSSNSHRDLLEFRESADSCEIVDRLFDGIVRLFPSDQYGNRVCSSDIAILNMIHRMGGSSMALIQANLMQEETAIIDQHLSARIVQLASSGFVVPGANLLPTSKLQLSADGLRCVLNDPNFNSKLPSIVIGQIQIHF